MTKSNAARLRELMQANRMTRREVADITGRGESTVDSWLAPIDSNSYRPMPSHALELLELKLKSGAKTK